MDYYPHLLVLVFGGLLLYGGIDLYQTGNDYFEARTTLLELNINQITENFERQEDLLELYRNNVIIQEKLLSSNVLECEK